jgi:hypothetical protein
MARVSAWKGAVLFLALGGCNNSSADGGGVGSGAVAPLRASLPGQFALVARVPAETSEALEALLVKDVVPAIGQSSEVRDVNTFVARDGGDAVYVVQVNLRRPGARSPNMAFELLAKGRSFEDAQALQATVKKYFSVAPLVAERRQDLSVNRTFSLRSTSPAVAK